MDQNEKQLWIPSIIEETCNGTGIIPLEAKHLTDRKLFINGPVTEGMADNMVSEFLYLADNDEPVDIYINSPGGSISDGLVIYDLIQNAPFEINIYCTGMAASMGAVLLACGAKGHRFILPHSKVMIHEPLIPGGLGGSATSIKTAADSIMETRSIVADILSKHTGKSKKAICKAISFDNYMNAEEAVAFGLCDEVRGLFGTQSV
ncbi:MAG: ATP-dependent Clp protease proteolytic subunit [Lachnospiraceae bacterium]|nr:ATP-dependent Clp protease proteolytic subunit [Lachnospiraceae bacterium]